MHRVLVLLCGCVTALGVRAAAFGLDTVTAMATDLAAKPYRAQPSVVPKALRELSYDDYRSIRFRPEASWWRGAALPFELQFFHVGRGYTEAVRMHEVIDGQAHVITVPATAFRGDLPAAEQALASMHSQAVAGKVAGFRAHTALNEASIKDELIVFQGASYFRALGAGQTYGLSARGLALDTTGAPAGRSEEFPVFESFWIERPKAHATQLVIYALLNSPRAVGAYRFVVRPPAAGNAQGNTAIDVDLRVVLREPVATLGLAPLTSMFLAGENQPQPLQVLGDFRPEVHDSDGLQIESASGEWLWRPLVNPSPRSAPLVTSFRLDNPRGFGLMQRDRRFASYEDAEARYDRRPSAWVVPRGDWGAGRIELMQFHTPDETNDNVAAYWVPAQAPRPGEVLSLAYTLHWQGEAMSRPPGLWTRQSRLGRSHEVPGASEVQFQIDFSATNPPPAPDAAGTTQPLPRAVVSASDNARVLLSEVQPHPIEGWRLILRLQRLDATRPVELRAFLQSGQDVITETWTYALPTP